MSINKGHSKNKNPVRICGQHGWGCTKKCSSIKNGYLDSRPKKNKQIKK